MVKSGEKWVIWLRLSCPPVSCWVLVLKTMLRILFSHRSHLAITSSLSKHLLLATFSTQPPPSSLPSSLQRCIHLSQQTRRSGAHPTTNSDVRSAYSHLRSSNIDDIFSDNNDYVRLLRYLFDRCAWSAARPPRRNEQRQSQAAQAQSLDISRDIFKELTSMQRTSAGGALLSKNMYSHMTLALCTAADSRGQASAWDPGTGHLFCGSGPKAAHGACDANPMLIQR